MDIYKTVVKNQNGNKKFEIVDVWFASAYYIWQTGQAKTFPSGLKMKAFGSNPLSRVRSICDGPYACERDDCNAYGPSGQTQNGVLPTTGCNGKMADLGLSLDSKSADFGAKIPKRAKCALRPLPKNLVPNNQR